MKAEPEQAHVVLYWTYYDGRDGGRRGHAYLHAEPGRARLRLYEHAPEAAAKEAMMARHDRWQRTHPASPVEEFRRRTTWRDPSASWSLTGDLGVVREVLQGRTLEKTLLAPGMEPIPSLSEDFLRRPIGCFVERGAGVPWPDAWEAPAVCPGLSGPLVRRSGDVVLVCAARYGSRFSDSGQNRTAAIWRSDDGGKSWVELPWTLGPIQRMKPSGRWCWPPEEVDRLSAEPLTIEWDDPWIDWEPGTEWRATWSPAKQQWRMARR